MRKFTIRVPMTTTALILVLAQGIREVLNIQPIGHEHWEFMKYDNELEGDNEQYYGKGGVRINYEQSGYLHLRCHIELCKPSNVKGAKKKYWIIRIWTKQPDSEEITAVGFGFWKKENQLDLSTKRFVPEQPHARIRF